MPAYNITMSREFWNDMGQLPPPVYPRAIRTAERMLQDPWASELHPEKVRRAEEGVHSCQVDSSYRIIWKHIKPNDEVGVPPEALSHVRALEDVNQLEMVERLLPEEVYDRLIGLALDIVDRPAVPDHQLQQSLQRYQGGDDLYRFVDGAEFKRVLAGTMEEWMLFLAPHQKQLVNRVYNGPARIKGVAGSGKTVVAIHRARYLARAAAQEGRKVLFLTYGSRLPGVVHHLLNHLAGEGAPELDAVECVTIHQWCYRFLARHGRRPTMDDGRKAYNTALERGIVETRPLHPGLRLWSRPSSFFAAEIRYSIKGRAVATLEEYLALERSGRGTPLQETERRAVWAIYEGYQEYLEEHGLWDFDDYVLEALRLVDSGMSAGEYTAAVVDEIQDLTEAVMRLIRRIVSPGSNDLFLVGDGLQRIYPGGYALGRLDINITGRGTLLRKNYRNTQEILRAAHALMRGEHLDDMDETEGEIPEPEFSVRCGPAPVLHRFRQPDEEMQWVRTKIEELKATQGYRDRDFAILYRWRWPYRDLITRHLGSHIQLAELQRDAITYFGPGVKHTTFHSAKGLEFKVVFIIGATDGQFVPKDDWTIEGEELNAYLARERRLLYVAMTRARDLLYVSCSRGQPSRFLSSVPEEYLKRE